MSQQHEHEFEAALGLPEPLPDGESILWQGAPDWKAMALNVFHVRTIALYFLAMLIWRFGTTLSDGGSGAAALLSIALPVPLALLAIGILLMLAWLVSRTTVYTLTNQRVVMRIGIVLCITFNLPYRSIEAVDMRLNPDGTGDISFSLASGNQIAYANLWPHARPWKVQRTQPTLRCIPQAERVGKILAVAMGSPDHSSRHGHVAAIGDMTPPSAIALARNQSAASAATWSLPQWTGGWFHV